MPRYLLVVAVLLAGLSAAQAETRVALVIGNGTYASVPRLPNPTGDADTVAAALRGNGFDVTVAHDLGRAELLRALRQFESAANAADWALVYYAGHGVEVNGVNYLVPIDAQLRSDRDVDEEAVPLSQVQKRLEGAHKLRIVILDACRDNPFLVKMSRTLASRSIGRGLARPELPQTGSIVAYSAGIGQTASDGETVSRNSPYATALIKNLAEPDVEVNLFFRRVRADVLQATGQAQEPATYESLPAERYVFKPSVGAVTPPQQEDESAFIDVVKGLSDRDVLVRLSRHASAPVMAAAKARLAMLTPGAPSVPAPPVQTAAVPVAPLPHDDTDQAARVARCDRATAWIQDLDRPKSVSPVQFASIDGKAAVIVCRAALERERDNVGQRRLHFELGRALEADKKIGDAIPEYRMGHAAGSAAAAARLGHLYSIGQGVPPDAKAAASFARDAADRGSATSMVTLGIYYMGGDGVPQDAVQGRSLFAKAADLGDPAGMVALGGVYLNGEGGPKDVASAKALFEKGAVSDDAMALLLLGTIHLVGAGDDLPADPAKARGFLERSATAGNTLAMVLLGSFYAEGSGVPRDVAQARSWFEKALAAGDSRAQKKLDELKAPPAAADAKPSLAMLPPSGPTPAPPPAAAERRGGSWDILAVIEAKGPVDRVAMGGRFVAGAVDKTIRIFDAETKAPVRDIAVGTAPIRAFALSPDGTRVAADTGKGMVVWDTSTGKPAVKFGKTNFDGGPTAVAFSVDGKYLAASNSGTTPTYVWDLSAGRLVRSLEDGANALAFSDDGKTLLSSGDFGWELKAWDFTHKGKAKAASSYNFTELGYPHVVSPSRDGARMAFGFLGGDILVLDVPSGNVVSHFKRSTTVEALALSPDGQRIVSAGAGLREPRVWDLKGNLIRILASQGEVSNLTFSADGTRIVSGGTDTMIRIWPGEATTQTAR